MLQNQSTISASYPFSPGTTECSCSICHTGQTAFTSTSDGTSYPVETSCSTTGSQQLDFRSDQTSSGLVDQQGSVPSRWFYRFHIWSNIIWSGGPTGIGAFEVVLSISHQIKHHLVCWTNRNQCLRGVSINLSHQIKHHLVWWTNRDQCLQGVSIEMSHQIKHNLIWWTNRDQWLRGVSINLSLATHTLFTDASNSGWGCIWSRKDILFHGVWTTDLSRLSMNVRNDGYLIRSDGSLAHHKQTTVMVATDNVHWQTKRNIDEQGGTHSPTLCAEVWKLLMWCHQRGKNSNSQTYSWQIQHSGRSPFKDVETHSDRLVSQRIASQVFLMTEYLCIDLFATRLNNRLPVYVSPIPDNRVLAIDALSMNMVMHFPCLT